MMIFSLVAMIGLEKCCITSACLQWLCHSGERTVARGPLVTKFSWIYNWDIRKNRLDLVRPRPNFQGCSSRKTENSRVGGESVFSENTVTSFFFFFFFFFFFWHFFFKKKGMNIPF